MKWTGTVVVCTLSGCVGLGIEDIGLEPLSDQGTPVDQRVHLEHDDDVLAERVHYFDDELAVLGARTATAGSLRMTLVARVDTPRAILGHDLGQFEHVPDEDRPTVDLMATTVRVHGNTAVVAYHYGGTIYAGGLDVFDVTAPSEPRLRSFGHYEHLDINSAIYAPSHDEDIGDGYIYATSSTCDPEYYPWNAVVERTHVVDHELTLDASYRFGLHGKIGVSAATDGDVLVAAGGVDGAATVVDYTDRQRLADIPLDDARWIAMDDSRAVVLSGNVAGAGFLQTLDLDTFELGDAIELAGVNQLDAKNTVELAADRAFVAAGPGGLHVVDIAEQQVLTTIDVPADTGYDASEVTTNAVSVDDDLIVVANGAAGVSLYDASDLRFLGRVDIAGSANHVEYRQGHVFVAGGTEGLHVIRVDRD